MYVLMPQKVSLINQWTFNLPITLPQKKLKLLTPWHAQTTGVKYFQSENLIVFSHA